MTDLMSTMGTTTTDAEMTFDERSVPEQLQAMREELAALKAELVRLDADLDESRRLNLRAAELLDVVYEELGTLRPEGGHA